MNKSTAWLLGGIAGIATFGLLPLFAIGLLEGICIVLPVPAQVQEPAVVVIVLAALGAAIFVSNWVTKRLTRPSGKSELQGVITYLRAGIRPLRLARDLVIILAISAHYGVVTALTTFEVKGMGSAQMTLALTNMVSMLVGFFIASYLTPERRWTHLGILALATWLVGLLNVAFFGVTIADWMGSLLFILITMGLGGGLATLLNKRVIPAPPLPAMSSEIEFICEHCGERLAIAADLVGYRVACGRCGKASQVPAIMTATVRYE